MQKHIETLLFALGLAVVAWVGAVHAASNPMVLGVCLLIVLVYVVGYASLRRYQNATVGLQKRVEGLSETPAVLEDWLQPLDASLRTVVRLRVSGERVALPAPTLPAYFSGVLVLLGMLGTLLGMMATLRGTGMALESASDLQAIRDSLAAPVKGLGYAFGTSIAGIATSAVLGVLTAFARKQRLEAGRALDAAIAGCLRVFTDDYRQNETWELLRRQSELMPTLVERLQVLAEHIERRDEVTHAQLLERQQTFLARNETAYVQLAQTVQTTLQGSVMESAQATSQALQPVVQAAMAEVTKQAAAVQTGLAASMQTYLSESQSSLSHAVASLLQQWQQAMDAQQHGNEAAIATLRNELSQAWSQVMTHQQEAHAALAGQQHAALNTTLQQHEQQSVRLLEQFAHTQQSAQAATEAQETQRLQQWQQALSAQAEVQHAQWKQITEEHTQQQTHICQVLETTAQAIATQGREQIEGTIAEIGKLMRAASDAPRMAAEVMSELRQSLSESMQRDTAMLAERNQLLETLGTLLDSVNSASNEQKQAIAALVNTSSAVLEQVSTRFDTRIETDTAKLDAAATRASAGAVELASLADVFSAAVEMFAQSNTQLAERLQRIESTLEKTLTRSDEQLAYYVAQAREVVDLSLLAQRQIVDDLRQLEVKPTAVAKA